ncbi:sensor histidine kinase [Hymenobacter rubripertinctus]|uniref:histidine kinase n=1 Tax=Hymenobacter rubripertinctus TaxID=2029981 RepID=A0A418R382_9BACT|nr:response regulator [Hymenobacter rubripertinctus]RIY11846.1 response regulator [Hymenobacter rubripertinctus]
MKKILLVDDNEADRMLYRRYLNRQQGHETLDFREAASGEEALAVFGDYRPDCVLLDYNLPDMTGMDILLGLQQRRPVAELCVIMITGGGSEMLAARALNSGASDYLVKGAFDQELLSRTVRHAIEKNEWRQYHARYHQELESVNQRLRDSLISLEQVKQELDHKNEALVAAHQQQKHHNHELDRINRQLARTNADLDNFVYAASHDLRQPVHNLRGLFEELRRGATFHDPDAAQLLRLTDTSLLALTTTIDDLSRAVQEQRRSGEEPTQQVVLSEVMADVCQTLQTQVNATNARILTDFTACPTVRYARTDLRTVLLNLVANAIKYRRPEAVPVIRVRSLPTTGPPVVQVQDNGLGIDLNRHGAELFQLFRRFHPEVASGTGVGLFLVNRLVQTAGGHVEVESQPGAGTTFSVHLAQ